MKTCRIENCFRPVFTNGYCSTHKYLHYNQKQAGKKAVGKIAIRYSVMSIEDLWLVADRHFNRFIRERDKLTETTFYCPTCDKEKVIDGDNYNACHLFPKHLFGWLRYNEDNVHGGCKGCNLYKHSAGHSFHPYVLQKIGKERYEALTNLNTYHKHHGFKWEREALILIIEKYKQLNKIAA